MLFTRTCANMCAAPRCNGMDRFYASACIVRRKRLFDHRRDKTMRERNAGWRVHTPIVQKSNEVVFGAHIPARGNAYGNNTASGRWRLLGVCANRRAKPCKSGRISKLWDMKKKGIRNRPLCAHAKVNIGILRVAFVEAVREAVLFLHLCRKKYRSNRADLSTCLA